MGRIYIARTAFPVEAKVITFNDPNGFNGMQIGCSSFPRPSQKCPGLLPYSPKAPVKRPNRFSNRKGLGDNPSVAAAQGMITQLILHHDGCPSSQVCFNVLHNERGLSCHFLIDNDGTIYQTVDLAFMAWHAAGFNTRSVGIEVCSRGDAKKDPNYYARKGGRRTATCRIHGHTYLAFDFTDKQYEALKALAIGLSRALPNLPLDYPQDSPGHQAWGTADHAASFKGWMGHYHTTIRKWDPGAFDFKKFIETVRGRRSFPIVVKGDKPDIPPDGEALRKASEELYALNELKANTGFYPVGPYGESKLWHGGVHIRADRGTKIYAPFAGRVVVARMRSPTSLGSVNFVLLRHDMSVGASSFRFWSLYFHVEDVRNKGDAAPKWTQNEKFQEAASRNAIALLDEPVEAGEFIATIGFGGPAEYQNPQLHFEIVTRENIHDQIAPGSKWQLYDGTGGGRFANIPTLNEVVDKNTDGKLDRAELLGFYQRPSGERDLLSRWACTLHTSEWTSDPEWLTELKTSGEYHGLRDDELEELIDEQITPGLWWTEAVAKHAKLDQGGLAYHYHPITFVHWINEKLAEADALADDGVGAFDASEARVTPDGVTDDIGDEEGESFIDLKELEEGTEGKDMTFDDIANGFEDIE